MRTNRGVTSAAMALTLAVVLAGCDTDDGGGPGGPTGSQDVRTTTSPDGTAQTGAAGQTSGPSTGDEEARTTQASPEGDQDADPTDVADDDTDDDGRDDDSDGVVGGGPAADLTPSALAAVETALGELGGTAYSVDDREDGFWEVQLLVDGAPVLAILSPDGTILESSSPDDDEELDDGKAEAVAAAGTTLAEAVVAAVRAAEAQLDSAELEEVDGAWSWTVTVDTAEKEDVVLHVDPASGKVVASKG